VLHRSSPCQAPWQEVLGLKVKRGLRFPKWQRISDGGLLRQRLRTGQNQLYDRGCRSIVERATYCQMHFNSPVSDHCSLCGLRAVRARWTKSPVCAGVILKRGKCFELFVGASRIPDRCCGSAPSLSDQHKSDGVHDAAVLPTKDPMFIIGRQPANPAKRLNGSDGSMTESVGFQGLCGSAGKHAESRASARLTGLRGLIAAL
jgi:hypothetical protein